MAIPVERLSRMNITPQYLRDLDNKRLSEVCEFIMTKAVDQTVVNDLIRDRNDFRYCYFKLIAQLQDLGVEPVVEYDKLHYTKGERKL